MAADKALATFRHAAAAYEAGKPADWPDAPQVEAAPWCTVADCSDVK